MRGTRTRRLLLASAGLAAGFEIVLSGGPALAGDHCAPPRLLPAYAHNDYRNARPLRDAIERGYGGVEADVFIMGAASRLGHDRPDADSSRTLEAVYLEPLAGRFAECGFVQVDSIPFLLLIEDKSPAPEGREVLADRLEGYRHLFQAPAGPRGEPAVEVVLVDEAASTVPIPPRLAALAGRQWRATRQVPVPPPEETSRYRLFSVDWRQEFDWEGSGRPPAATRKLLAALVAAKALSPGSRIRVHNVPARTALYRFLVESGVDLVGVTDLRKGSDIFEALSR